MQETDAFAKAQTLDQHKALIHIFFAQRATKKVRMPCSCLITCPDVSCGACGSCTGQQQAQPSVCCCCSYEVPTWKLRSQLAECSA